MVGWDSSFPKCPVHLTKFVLYTSMLLLPGSGRELIPKCGRFILSVQLKRGGGRGNHLGGQVSLIFILTEHLICEEITQFEKLS